MDYTKMMATLAVAGMTAVAGADIVSSSVVGYQNKGFENQGYSIVANTFEGIGIERDAMTLGDIKVNDEFVNSKLVFMTTGGATARTTFGGKTVAQEYVYWTEEDAEDGAGWYLAKDEDATVNCNDVELPFGSGILVYRTTSEADAQLVCSGQVSTTPVTKGFPNSGYTPIGNCCPLQISLGDITVNDDFVNSKIVFMTTGGATARTTFGGKTVAKEYVYWTEEDAEDGAGWYLAKDEDATVNCNDSITFEAGDGFLVYRTASEVSATITLPKAL